ncbi:ABC transporter permease [Actinoalloteichus hymeniacidonis]|uniref:Transport permease protein n=1 Tax=Actinoalloteichus hymeniacidonis TaxID=340345 RepID=A0AAC9HNF4_9PSEU|nr:ABC transporter permease [Actinoalloteichus hymeniacidonis]AOS62441.1 ABC-type multidrug transport system, permease component [Actinoalloteichus hymeniacidonis]MBB5909528.1 lipooligosaccharide transport system permease protein [Actinoalloteichus hymeniacidonis]
MTVEQTRTERETDPQPSRWASGLRIFPPGLYAGRASRLVERSLLAGKGAWLAILSGFFEPVFYLISFGFAFGGMVGQISGPGGAPIEYAAFIAPGLLAVSAMNGAVYDATFNIFFKLRYAKLYDAVLATPMGPLDVAIAEIAWAVLRGGVYAAGFLSVMFGMGLITSPWALLALPVALLISFAFAAVGMAATTFIRSTQDFDFVQLAILPMALFSTTFFPLEVYPRVAQFLVQCLPLFHGVELMRALATGVVSWGLIGHVGYFVVMAGIGVIVATRRLEKLLLT